ncbi:uncharacterized protein LOC129940122 [Eupeodes corollae]|uniref:uncharacterized protein LOC129940122 n=1 Tax=Eupeodes corollae TaxID=290404 RepID=UPI0024931495|nr:uncharacterized protein LOC129940122 [Eupeodes corollae]
MKNEEDRVKMQDIPYREAVGSLLYASQGTRPDIAHAVGVVSKYLSNPGHAHWKAVKRIMRYLKGTIDAKIEYSKNDDSELLAYSDADWANEVDDRRSVSGYILKMQGGPISWDSKRQKTIALSTTEAEYMALSAACQEVL